MTREEVIERLYRIKIQASMNNCTTHYDIIRNLCNTNFIEDNGGKIVPYVQELSKNSNDNYEKCLKELDTYIEEIIHAVMKSEKL